MNYDIRNISMYVGNIHSRYYIDTEGVVYTSLSGNTDRITINGERYNIKGFKKSNINKLNQNNQMMIELPYGHSYYLLYNGLILKRLSTRCNNKNEIDVCLTTLNDRKKGKRWSLHRLMGYVFLNLNVNDSNMEIHHKDGDRTNNKLTNLELLPMNLHRGAGNFNLNHNK